VRRAIPVLIASLAGFVLVIAFFIPWTQSWGEGATIWFNILAGVAFVLGGANLVKVQLESISARRPGWGYAVVTIVSFLAMFLAGLLKIGVHPADQYATFRGAANTTRRIRCSACSTRTSSRRSPRRCLRRSRSTWQAPRSARFRAKNLEAILLLGTAFIVLIGNTAIARLTYGLPDWLSFLRLDTMVANLMKYVSTGTGRAITIGIAVGVAATSLRILLGIDRPYLSRN
jgi:hypothetical protein